MKEKKCECDFVFISRVNLPITHNLNDDIHEWWCDCWWMRRNIHSELEILYKTSESYERVQA